MNSNNNNNLQATTANKATATSVLLYFLKMFVSPVNGWKSVKSAALRSEDVAARLFYPSLALISVGEFLKLIYNHALTVTELLQDAVITFVAFFAGYFSILFLVDFIFAKDVRAKITTEFGKTYILMNLTTLVIFYLVYEIIPLAAPVLVFTPIYTLYIIIKGAKCLRVPEHSFTSTICKLTALIIGVPMLIYYIFDALMPTA